MILYTTEKGLMFQMVRIPKEKLTKGNSFVTLSPVITVSDMFVLSFVLDMR